MVWEIVRLKQFRAIQPDDCHLLEGLLFSILLIQKFSLQRSSTTENSIEKPTISRSLSGGIPPTKPHLLNALRNAQEIATNEDNI
jgi:hypothetical protein